MRWVRDLADRRAIRVELTEVGRAKLDAAAPAEQGCVATLFRDLSPEVLATLITTLTEVERRAS